MPVSDAIEESAAEERVAVTSLSQTDAERRLASEGHNVLPGTHRRTLLHITLETVREPMFLLLLAAGTLYLVFGDLQEGLTLFGFVLITLGLTLYQEGQTERRVDQGRARRTPGADRPQRRRQDDADQPADGRG